MPSNHEIPGPDGISAVFNHTFNEEVIKILSNMFYGKEKEGILPNPFYEAGITPIPKGEGPIKERKPQTIPLMNSSCQ